MTASMSTLYSLTIACIGAPLFGAMVYIGSDLPPEASLFCGCVVMWLAWIAAKRQS